MDALLLVPTARIRNRLVDALREADHVPGCYETLSGAQQAYAKHIHPLVFVECPCDAPTETLPFDPDRSVVTAVLAPDALHEGLRDARTLQADALLDRYDTDVLAARLDLIAQRARKKSASRAPDSSERFHMLTEALDSINDAALIADAQAPDLPIVYCNEAFETLTGYRRQEALGRNCRFLQGSGTSKEARKHIRSALENGRSCTVALKNYRKDGTPFWNEITISPIRNAANTVTHFLGILHDITEQRERAHQIEQNEEVLRRIVDALPQMIFLKDESGTYLLANQSTAEAYGTTPDELEGATDAEFAAAEADRNFRMDDQHVIASNEPKVFVETITAADGSERTLKTELLPFDSLYRDERLLLCIATDITEQKHAERMLRIREEQHRVLAELGLHALEEADLDTFIEEVIHRLTDTLDLSLCSILELRSEGELLHPAATYGWPAPLQDAALHLADAPLLQRTLTADEPLHLSDPDATEDLPFIDADRTRSGVSIVIQGRNQPYGILTAFSNHSDAFTRDDVNFLQTIAVLISDAVERRHSEMELLLSEKRYRSVVEQQTELICRFDPDGTITFVNHAFRSFVGEPAEVLIDQSILDWMPASDHDAFRELMRSSTPDAPVQKRELRLFDAEGEVRWLQWAVRGFFQADGSVAEFQASGRDITERKQLEREILDVSARERRRIGQDLHDGLGSHLSGVAMLCRGVIRKIEAGEPVDPSVMEEIVQLVHESISQVRKLARGLNPVRMEDEGLCSALQELASSAQAHPGVHCTFSCDSDVPTPEREVALHLYRIAQEALTNALKHADADRIHLDLGTTDDRLVLTVRDDGVGLSEATDEREGMGLRVMNYRANTIGAKLHIRPRPGGGTRVECTLPADKLTHPG